MLHWSVTRKVIPVLLGMAFLIPACSPLRAPDCRAADILCVGLVTDVSGLHDRGYNRYAWDGIQQAKSDEVVDWAEVIETMDDRDFARNIAVFTDEGYDVIVTIGTAMSAATTKVAIAYKNTFFISVNQWQAWADDDIEGNDIPNLAGITFPEEKAGFLMGALAAMMTQTGQVGAVCSTDLDPGIWKYCEGFRQGVGYIDPALTTTVRYHNDVPIGDAFSDPGWGADTARNLVDQGVDILFGAGGETGSSAITAAVQRGGIGLGAEFDQHSVLVVASPRLLSRGILKVDQAVYNLLDRVRVSREQDREMPAGNFTGQVGYAPFHDLENLVSAEIRARLEEIRIELITGKIVVLEPATENEP